MRRRQSMPPGIKEEEEEVEERNVPLIQFLGGWK